MSYRMALVLVFGIVFSLGWGSSMSSVADSGATYTTDQSQVAIR